MQDFSLPFLIAPPFLTMAKWEMGKQAVNSFYFNETPELTLDLLEPRHSEILAEEWLRRNKLLLYKLYRTGETMKDFDIVGLNEKNELVVVQVKYDCKNSEIEDFIEKVELMRNTNGYFFTKKDDFKHKSVFSLNKIFNDFNNDKEYLSALISGRL